MFKEKFGSHNQKHSIDLLQKAAIPGTSHRAESTAVCPMKPELWKSPLVQEEKYQGKNRPVTIITIIIIMAQ
jgi:hypothetical protein